MRRVRRSGFAISCGRSVKCQRRRIETDNDFLHVLWREFTKREQCPLPRCCIPTCPSLCRGTCSKKWIDCGSIREEFEAIRDFAAVFPEQTSRIHFYDGDEPLLIIWGWSGRARIEPESLAQVGGYLVIDHTEAMTVIDVYGRFVENDQKRPSRNNLEAYKEVAYQLKLVGIGGIIIVDSSTWNGKESGQGLSCVGDAMASDRRERGYPDFDLGLINFPERVRRICCVRCRSLAATATAVGIRSLPRPWCMKFSVRFDGLNRLPISNGLSWEPIQRWLNCCKTKSDTEWRYWSGTVRRKLSSHRTASCILNSTIWSYSSRVPVLFLWEEVLPADLPAVERTPCR